VIALLGFLGVSGLFAVIVVLLALGPFATIWALNLLFHLEIPYTFWTWLAVFWLQLLFAKTGSSK
jgi:hypothetical protein